LAGQAVNVFRVPLAHAGTAPPTAVTLTTAQNLMLGAWESGKAVIAVNQMRASPWSLPCDLNTGTVNGELRQVTEGQAGGAHPAIMRDGSLLAYASSKTGSQSLFLKDLRTGRERLLAAPLDSGGALAHVHFSPDGKQVVASHSRQSVKSYTLVTVPTVGGEMKPFHPEGSRVRAWSPDGRWVLVWLPANNQIAVIDVISRKQTVLLSDGFTEPSLSADGKWLAFVAQQGRQLYVAPFRGDQAISKELWIPIAGQVGYPFWAPDGNSLYYAPSPGMDFSTEASTTIVRRKLDPQTKQPLGDAAVFFRSEGMIFGSAVTNPIPVARDQIILQMNVINSDLWALDVPARRR
jgi:Tol biopolymer transport system component